MTKALVYRIESELCCVDRGIVSCRNKEHRKPLSSDLLFGVLSHRNVKYMIKHPEITEVL